MQSQDAVLKAAGERLEQIGDRLREGARGPARDLEMRRAFLLGVLPLAVATGAGSGGQHAIGTGVVGGMLSATVLAIFLVPAFFVIVLGLAKVKRHGPAAAP